MNNSQLKRFREFVESKDQAQLLLELTAKMPLFEVNTAEAAILRRAAETLYTVDNNEFLCMALLQQTELTLDVRLRLRQKIENALGYSTSLSGYLLSRNYYTTAQFFRADDNTRRALRIVWIDAILRHNRNLSKSRSNKVTAD